MKKIFSAVIIFIALTAPGSAVEPLSRIGREDSEALALIKGQWIIDDTRFIHEYTGRFATRIDGLKYYHYKRLNSNSRQTYIYTIVRSLKTGQLYFARGSFQKGRFLGTTSRIVFKGKNRLIVYFGKEPEKIYLKATRIKHKNKR